MKAIICGLLLLGARTAPAQNCGGYYYLSSSEVEMTTYDAKGSENGKVIYHISDVAKSGSTTSARFQAETMDKRGKNLSKSSGTYKCIGGLLYVDARTSMGSDQMAAYKDMDVKMEEAYIEYPYTMSEDQLLKDASFKMTIYDKSGNLFATVNFEMTNRKVKGKENVTTSAGSWECWKISFDCKMRSEVAGIGIPVTFRTTEWFAPGVGVIRSESYKGVKTMGSSAITSIKK